MRMIPGQQSHMHKVGNMLYKCWDDHRNSGPGCQGTIEDAHTGGWSYEQKPGHLGCFDTRLNEGYVIDQNRNGRYDRGQDAVLMFDNNRDGRFDQKDVQSTNDMMKAAQGNYDFNHDGRVSVGERMQGAALRARYNQLDVNHDGTLSAQEIERGGGKVWVDHDRSGNMQNNEIHSTNAMPNPRGTGPSQRLDHFDPFNHHSHTSNNTWNCLPNGNPWGPFGGGYPGGNGNGGYLGGFGQGRYR